MRNGNAAAHGLHGGFVPSVSATDAFVPTLDGKDICIPCRHPHKVLRKDADGLAQESRQHCARKKDVMLPTAPPLYGHQNNREPI